MIRKLGVFFLVALVATSCGRKSTKGPEAPAASPGGAPVRPIKPRAAADSEAAQSLAPSSLGPAYQPGALLEGGCRLTTASFPALLREYFKQYQSSLQGDPSASIRAEECRAWISELVLGVGALTPRAKAFPVFEDCDEWLGTQNLIRTFVEDSGYPLKNSEDPQESIEQLKRQGSYASLITRLDSCSDKYPEPVALLAQSMQQLWELKYLDQASMLWLNLKQNEREVRQEAARLALLVGRTLSYGGAWKIGLNNLAVSSNFQLFNKFVGYSMVLPAATGAAVYKAAPYGHRALDKPLEVPDPPAFLMRIGASFEVGLLENARRADEFNRFMSEIQGAATGAAVSAAIAIRYGGKAYKFGTKVFNIGTIPFKWNPAVIGTAVAAVGSGIAVDHLMSEGSLRLTELSSRHELRKRVIQAAHDFDVAATELRSSQSANYGGGETGAREVRARLFQLTKSLLDRALMYDMAKTLPVMEAQLNYEYWVTTIELRKAAAESQYQDRRKALIHEAFGRAWSPAPFFLAMDFTNQIPFRFLSGDPATNAAPTNGLTNVTAAVKAAPELKVEEPADPIRDQIKSMVASTNWLRATAMQIADQPTRRSWSRRALDAHIEVSQARSDLKSETQDANEELAAVIREHLPAKGPKNEGLVRQITLAEAWLRTPPAKIEDVSLRWSGADAKVVQELLTEAGPSATADFGELARFFRNRNDVEFDRLRTELLAGQVSDDPPVMLMQVMALIRSAGHFLILKQSEDVIATRLRFYRLIWDRLGVQP